MDSMNRRKYSSVPIVQGVRTAPSPMDASYEEYDVNYAKYDTPYYSEQDGIYNEEFADNEAGGDARHASYVVVDYNAVSIYVPGAQLIFAIVGTCLTSSASTLLTHVFPMNAVRSIFITLIVSVLLMYKPL